MTDIQFWNFKITLSFTVGAKKRPSSKNGLAGPGHWASKPRSGIAIL